MKTTLEPLPPLAAQKFVVRYAGYAVKFHTNVCGDVYSLVADHEASTFFTPELAMQKCVKHNLNPKHVTVNPL